MGLTRKPFQGVWNIVRFNWPFYIIAGIGIIGLIVWKNQFPLFFQFWVIMGVAIAGLTTVVSLIVSYYIYDYSSLYDLNWLPNSNNLALLNINAGFDETSLLIKNKYPSVNLTICDFYDPKKHTEISIKRARKAYPPPLETIPVTTQTLPFSDNKIDYSLAILAAHEIRDEVERVRFFKELNRITKNTGAIYVMEHLRDINNFLAYNIGYLHFYSRKTWLRTFTEAELSIKEEIKITPFITLFILASNGNTP